MDGDTLNGAGAFSWRSLARTAIELPGLRLLMPGWPDAGRSIVQAPALEPLLARAVADTGSVTRALNAGAGESLYSPVMRRFIGAAQLVEFDYGPPPAGSPRTAVATRFMASLSETGLASSTMDLVVCTEVLEHVADDERAVAELRRVLTPRGRLVLSVPTPPAVPDAAHVREGYTLEELTRLFDRHELEILEARYCMHACFKLVLRWWRPHVVPLGAIVALAWCDRVFRPGRPMDLAVLAAPKR